MLQSNIRRGELDREVTFIKKVIGSSTTNEDKIERWIVVAQHPTVWAKKQDLAGTDIVIQGKLTYAQRTKFTIDYRTDINTENRLVYNGKVYEIIAVTDTNSSREGYQDVMCNLLDTEEWT